MADLDTQALRDDADLVDEAIGRNMHAAADTIDALNERCGDLELVAKKARAEVARLLVESETRLAVLRGCSGENQRLRDALAFYADEGKYRGHDPAILWDAGVEARAALGEETT